MQLDLNRKTENNAYKHRQCQCLFGHSVYLPLCHGHELRVLKTYLAIRFLSDIVWKAYTFLGVLDFAFNGNNFWSALQRFNFLNKLETHLFIVIVKNTFY